MKNQVFKQKQYTALEELAKACDVQNANGEKLYKALRKWENAANKASLDYCNGELKGEQFHPFIEHVQNEVFELFNCKLRGLFINTDPRGYSLKIRDTLVRGEGKYSNIRIYTDMGGDGILAPDFR